MSARHGGPVTSPAGLSRRGLVALVTTTLATSPAIALPADAAPGILPAGSIAARGRALAALWREYDTIERRRLAHRRAGDSHAWRQDDLHLAATLDRINAASRAALDGRARTVADAAV